MSKQNIWNPVSPSDTYVIYDQFHWNSKNHFSERVKGYSQALSRYRFHKVFHPECVLGLTTVEYYNHLVDVTK